MREKRFLAIFTFLMLLTTGVMAFGVAEAQVQFFTSAFINLDGSVTGTNNIQRNGNFYTLTGNISGGISVQKSYIVIDGAGYTIDGNGQDIGIDLGNGVGQDPTRPTISNVTIKNLRIVNCSNGVFTNGGGNNTFYNIYVSNCSRSQGGFGFFLLGCSYNNISYCTFDNESIISMDYQANYNTVTENNLMNSGVLVWLSGYETVDKNYWSDYFTRYPNATEIDSSGIGNTPYVFSTAQNGSIPVIYQDNHPLMQLVTTSQSTITEFPSWIILPLLIAATLFIIGIKKKHFPKSRIGLPKMVPSSSHAIWVHLSSEKIRIKSDHAFWQPSQRLQYMFKPFSKTGKP